MEEYIKSLLSISRLNFVHSTSGSIVLGLMAIATIAILAYCIYRMAVIGLKMAAVGAGLYFLLNMTTIISDDAKNTGLKPNSVGLNSPMQGFDLGQLRNDIKDLLEDPQGKVLPLLTGLQGNRRI